MNIEYFHASKFGSGAKVATEFQRRMASRGITANVHHIDAVRATQLPAADLYVFSSPGRMGKPIRKMRRFLQKLTLPTGTRYALLTTEGAPRPNKKTGELPSSAEQEKWQRVRPIMNEILESKGLVKVAEDCVFVTGLRGPLEDGWEQKVAAFEAALPVRS